MSKQILKRNIGSMSLAVFLSRISGLIRDQIFAYFFGVSFVADAFNFAYTIPNLLRRLFGEGALGAAFIPIYQEKGVINGKRKQIEFAINVLSLLTLFLSLISLLGIIFAPLIIKILTIYLPDLVRNLFGIQNSLNGGFDKVTFLLTIKLTRILFPYLFFIGISSTLIAILNSHNYYFIPGLSSALLNFAMISFLLFSHFFHINNKSLLAMILSVGVLLGGLLQVIINFPLLKKIEYKFKLNFSIKNEALKELWTKFLPGVWGIAVRQINLLVDRALASMLVQGSISALNYGNRVMQLPLGIFGISIGTAAIPHFSKTVAEKNYKDLNEKFSYTISLIALIMFPITCLIIVEGKDYLQLLFMRGAFNQKALFMSYNALLFYSFGLVFYSWNRVCTAIFYAFKNTKIPFYIASITVIINISLNLFFMSKWNYKGLALATSVSSFLQFIILIVLITKYFPMVNYKNVLQDICKMFLSTVITFFVIKSLTKFFVGFNFWSVFVRALIISLIGLLLFLFISFLLKVKTVKSILKNA